MAHAVCKECGHYIAWRATRGSRLADIKCPVCGERLTAYKSTTKPTDKGYRMINCTICGKRKKRICRPHTKFCEKYNASIIFVPLTPICGGHEIVAVGMRADILEPDPDHGGCVRFSGRCGEVLDLRKNNNGFVECKIRELWHKPSSLQIHSGEIAKYKAGGQPCENSKTKS